MVKNTLKFLFLIFFAYFSKGYPLLAICLENDCTSQSSRGKIPKNHIDIGPGVCPNDLEHHVHIIMNDANIPMFYKCSECRYQQFISRRKN